jgi:hypothetical protein
MLGDLLFQANTGAYEDPEVIIDAIKSIRDEVKSRKLKTAKLVINNDKCKETS